MNLKALTSKELESVLEAIDGIHAAYDTLEAAGAVIEDDIGLDELADAIVEEMTTRNYEDAGYRVNEMVGRGEVDRYMRPDGQIGYAPPGAWDELR